MARFKVDIEYEGTRYSGWQVQNNARTIQGEIMLAVEDALNTRDFDFMGSGRTDAGVHALHQVAHLDVETTISTKVLQIRLNDLLPADICIKRLTKVNEDFHARHSAISRSYIYQVSRRRTAFGKRFVWWVKDPLDTTIMRQACDTIVGMHDFRAFTADDPREKSTKVEMHECSLHEFDNMIVLRFRGSHFLWKMVRQLTGMIVESGRPGSSVDVARFLKTSSAIAAQKTAPPSGLFLEYVQYDEEEALPDILPFPWID